MRSLPILLLMLGWTTGCMKTAQKAQGPLPEPGGPLSQAPAPAPIERVAAVQPAAPATQPYTAAPHTAGPPLAGPPLAGPPIASAWRCIGQPAPEIVGEDVDGVPFRLSDYRGKVVVLDFWGHW